MILDDAGRIVAPAQPVLPTRAAGPWDANEDARPLADEHPCSWCPAGRVRTQELKAQGFRVSNSLCAMHEAEMDALNAELPDKRLPQYRLG